jgi:hypothetical protein
VLNFLVGLHRTAQNLDVRDVSLTIEDVNSEPALVLRIGGRLESLFVFSIDDGEQISAIRVVRNPDKLARIDHQLGAAAGRAGEAGRARGAGRAGEAGG